MVTADRRMWLLFCVTQGPGVGLTVSQGCSKGKVVSSFLGESFASGCKASPEVTRSPDFVGTLPVPHLNESFWSGQ